VRIVGPTLLASGGVECDNAVEGGGEVESAIHKNWGGFEAAALAIVAPVRNVTGMKDPGDF